MSVKVITNEKLAQALKKLGNEPPMKTRVGWLESTHEKNGVQTGYVAAIQEYGYAPHGLKPRPTMRPTIEERKTMWAKVMEDGAKQLVAGALTLKQVMTRIGDQSSGDFRRAISKLIAPPLAESTLAARRRKGNNSKKPLVDDRIMMETLTYTVSE